MAGPQTTPRGRHPPASSSAPAPAPCSATPAAPRRGLGEEIRKRRSGFLLFATTPSMSTQPHIAIPRRGLQPQAKSHIPLRISNSSPASSSTSSAHESSPLDHPSPSSRYGACSGGGRERCRSPKRPRTRYHAIKCSAFVIHALLTPHQPTQSLGCCTVVPARAQRGVQLPRKRARGRCVPRGPLDDGETCEAGGTPAVPSHR